MNDDSNVAHDSNSKFDKPNQGKGWKWQNVKTEHILKFLDNYQAPSDSVGRVSNPDILSKTILDQQDRNLINNWTVGLMDGGTNEYRGIANYPVKLAGRKEDKKKKPEMSNNGNIFFGAIAGGLSHTRFDLDLNDSPILFDGSTGESLENMIKLTVDQVKTKYGCTKSEYQRLARKPSNGLLLLYLIDNGDIPLLGWAIDFPNLENQKKTSIITRYQNQEGQQLEFEFVEINNEL